MSENVTHSTPDSVQDLPLKMASEEAVIGQKRKIEQMESDKENDGALGLNQRYDGDFTEASFEGVFSEFYD